MQPKQNVNSIDFSKLDGIKKTVLTTTVAVLIFIAFLLLIASFAIAVAGITINMGIYTIIIVSALAAILVAMYVDKKVNKFNEQLFNEFAAANQLMYIPIADDASQRQGTIFTHGHSKLLTSVLKGTLKGLPFEFGNYTYTVGSGKSQREYNLHLMELTLPRLMPHMVIDSLVEGTHSSTLPIEFDTSQRITLEGDFSKYFHLYAPDNYGVTALTILAPDAMQTLLACATYCDMEIIGNKLYFYWSEKATKRQQYEESFATVYKVLDEVGKKLTTADIFSSSTSGEIHSSVGQGASLRRSWFSRNKIIIYGAAFLLFSSFQVVGPLIEFYFSPFDGVDSLSMLAFPILIYGPLLLLFFKILKKKRLKDELARRYR